MAKAEKEKEVTNPVYIVVNEFRDIDNFDKKNIPGDDVSHFNIDRLEKLITLGLVEKK